MSEKKKNAQTKETDTAAKPEAVKKPAAKAAAPKAAGTKAAAETVKTAVAENPAPKKTAAKQPAAKKEKPAAEAVTSAEEVKKETVSMTTPSKKVISNDVKLVKENAKEIKAMPKPIDFELKKAASDKKKKILFAASEVQPFAGTGGLGEVMGSLGKSIAAMRKDYDVRVVLPLYEAVSAELREKLKYLKHISVQLSWRSQYCGIFEYVAGGVTYYFIDNEYYYKRPNLYGYYDDGERFAFFSKAVLDILPEVNFCPDVINSNDWQTALVPIYYKLYYLHREFYQNIKTVFTIHNIEYQGKYGRSIIEDVFGIAYREYPSVEHDGCINLMKGAIDYCDCVTTVSPTYAQEILSAYYAHGLQNILLKNSHKLRGILNGIDIETYDPERDVSLFKNYNADTAEAGKMQNKAELQAMLNLPAAPDVPLIAVISRLVGHKGIDLIKHVMADIIAENVQIVILGKGDADYENYFSYMQSQYPTKVCAIIAYNKDISHKIYAGSDFFLMPSKSEPCGLSQMIACRYGTIPIVRETGGLKDSITDSFDGTLGNGYTFATYNAHDMLSAIKRATGLYRDYKDLFRSLRRRAMEKDFSWGKSAAEYVKMYDWLIK